EMPAWRGVAQFADGETRGRDGFTTSRRSRYVRRLPDDHLWSPFMSSIAAPTPALSVLSEEEQLFRDTIRDFAETEIKPHVMEMDEAGKFRPDLLAKFFELGLMGVEVPEEYGGAG